MNNKNTFQLNENLLKLTRNTEKNHDILFSADCTKILFTVYCREINVTENKKQATVTTTNKNNKTYKNRKIWLMRKLS